MSGHPEGGKRMESKSNSGWTGKTALILAGLAVIFAGAALYIALKSGGFFEPPTFQYRGQTMTALKGMPVNEYDKENFSVDERGRIYYQNNGKQAKTGIDVSFYQQEIDWEAVAADGIDFAIIRLGYRGYTQG